MVTVPPALPVTTPEELMEATAGLLLLHTPPGDASERVTDWPRQTYAGPVITAGAALTVTGRVMTQPAPGENEMVATPDATPETTPVPEPTEAMAGLLLDHIPAPAGSVNTVVNPGQTVAAPEIADGGGVTVTMI